MTHNGVKFTNGMKVRAKSLRHTEESNINSDKGQSVGDVFTIQDIVEYPLTDAWFYVRERDSVGWHPGDLVPVSAHVKLTGEMRPI